MRLHSKGRSQSRPPSGLVPQCRPRSNKKVRVELAPNWRLTICDVVTKLLRAHAAENFCSERRLDVTNGMFYTRTLEKFHKLFPLQCRDSHWQAGSETEQGAACDEARCKVYCVHVHMLLTMSCTTIAESSPASGVMLALFFSLQMKGQVRNGHKSAGRGLQVNMT